MIFSIYNLLKLFLFRFNTRYLIYFSKYLKPFLIFIYFLLMFIRGFNSLDPDFGWHLKTGEIILEKGIPLKDPFSYTMPDFLYVDHSWAVDIVIAFSYPRVGMGGLSIIFTAILLTTIYLNKVLIVSAFKLKEWTAWVPIILLFGILSRYFLVRPQVFSWFFISVLFNLLFNEKVWQKFKFFTPLLFLVWANSHGGFSLGLGIFLFFGILKSIEERKLDIGFLINWLLSLIITLINPYGFGLWKEVGMTLFSGQLRTGIVEWMPVFYNIDFSLIPLIALSVVFISLYKNKFTKIEKLLFLFLLVSGLLSTKQIPFWAIFAAPIVSKGIGFLLSESKKYKLGFSRFGVFYNWIFAISFLSCLASIYLAMNNSLREDRFYPREATPFLMDNDIPGEIFSEYAWGGYLIWKYPQKKVFIDGRMAIWKQGETKGNLKNSFETYRNILTNKEDFEETFKNFNVKAVLLPVPKPPGNITKIALFLVTKFKSENSSELTLSFDKKLENAGFEKVYEDEVAVIYHRK